MPPLSRISRLTLGLLSLQGYPTAVSYLYTTMPSLDALAILPLLHSHYFYTRQLECQAAPFTFWE